MKNGTIIYANVRVVSKNMLLVGQVTKETLKAVKIDYSLEPILSRGKPKNFVASQTAWIPKSQIQLNNESFQIKDWFANNILKGYSINPYKV